MATDEPNLLSLPSKLIIRIFSYLPVSDLVLGVRPTCRRFRQISMVSELWKHVEIVNDENNCAPDLSLNFHCKMLDQKCIESVRDDDDSEGQETQDSPGGEDLTVKTVATSVVERGSVWPACSVTGQMFYPSLQQLTLKGTGEQWDFLVRYKHLTFLHIQLQDKAVTANFFETLRDLTSLKTLEFLLIDDFENPSSLGDAECIKDYFRTGPKLRRMCLEFDVRGEIMKTILEHCSELTDLLVWKSDFTSEVFQTVCENPNPVLSSLRIIKHPALDDGCVDAIPHAFPNLEKLELPLNHRTTNEGMRRLLKRCSQLTVLELNMSDQPSCDNIAESASSEIIHGEGFEHEAHEDDSGITNDPLHSDMVKDDPDDTNEGGSDDKKGEEGTDGAGTSVGGDTDPDPDNLEECSGDFLQELASDEKRGILQKLHLHNFLFSDANAFTALCRNQPNLRDVSLLHCRTRDEDIVALVENCRLLQRVTIESSEASSRAACALLNNLPCLVELTFNYNSANLETPGGRRMSRKRTSSGKLCELKQKTGQHRLNSLWIRSSYLDFTPSGIAALGSFCPSLVFLYINENVLLNDDGFMNILRCCAALQELRIEYFCSDDTEREAGHLTDDSLSHLLTHGRELRIVALPHCPRMTCPALARVIVRSPRLARFYLGVCKIQDMGDNFSRMDDPRVKGLIKSVRRQLMSLKGEKKARAVRVAGPFRRRGGTSGVLRPQAPSSSQYWKPAFRLSPLKSTPNLWFLFVLFWLSECRPFPFKMY